MKAFLKYFAVFVLGGAAGYFADMRSPDSWQKEFNDSRIAKTAVGDIVIASQIRHGKSAKAMEGLDAQIAYQISGIFKTRNRSQSASFACVLAKAYYDENKIPIPAEIAGYLSDVPSMPFGELGEIENMDHAELLSGHPREIGAGR